MLCASATWGRLTGSRDWAADLGADVRGDVLFLQRAALLALFDRLWTLGAAQIAAEAEGCSSAAAKLANRRDMLHAQYESDGPDAAAAYDALLEELDGLGNRVARVEAFGPDGGSAVDMSLSQRGTRLSP